MVDRLEQEKTLLATGHIWGKHLASLGNFGNVAADTIRDIGAILEPFHCHEQEIGLRVRDILWSAIIRSGPSGVPKQPQRKAD